MSVKYIMTLNDKDGMLIKVNQKKATKKIKIQLLEK